MCRLVGVVFRGDFPMGTLHDLSQVAETGSLPGEEDPGHKDGWGIVSFRNGSPLYVGRSCRPVFRDESFESALHDVLKLEPPNILIAHARALSRGEASIRNTHPFVIGGLVLCHNGTVRNIDYKPRHAVKGETDSELLLARLADRFEDSGNLVSSIKELVSKDIRPYDYSAAILLISDGQKLFAYRDLSEGNSAEYYDLRMAVNDEYVAFFQETRSGFDGAMSQIRRGELAVVDLDLNVEREMID